MAASASLSPTQLQAKFDLGISLILQSWEALSLAVHNHWGGPNSSDKRDWFAGAISDLFTTNPETDAHDIEDMLLQVMEDEFEVAVEDGSEISIAASIIQIKDELRRGEYSTVDALWDKWKDKKITINALRVGPSSDDEESVDEESDEDEDDDDDVEMAENPAVQQTSRRKTEPEVDEDGFTKVVGRRR